jgi:hypothetical protein
LPSIEGEYTVIGDVKEGKFLPFKDEIRIGKGDLAAILDKYSIHTSMSNFWFYVGQVFLFLGIWFGLYIARHQFLSFSILKSFSETRSTAIIALIITIATKFLSGYFFVISFLCIGIFLFTSRDKKNI